MNMQRAHSGILRYCTALFPMRVRRSSFHHAVEQGCHISCCALFFLHHMKQNKHSIRANCYNHHQLERKKKSTVALCSAKRFISQVTCTFVDVATSSGGNTYLFHPLEFHKLLLTVCLSLLILQTIYKRTLSANCVLAKKITT